ncbi:hypothetical protein N8Z24_00800 [bacterium]|nr:hypothetical protein [bacterium]
MKKLTTKEDIILLYLEDRKLLKRAFFEGRIKHNTDVRQAFLGLGDPELVFIWAFNVDQKPQDDTRKVCCKSPYYAFKYAYYIDKEKRRDTRIAASKDPGMAFNYAVHIDEKVTKTTKQAVLTSNFKDSVEVVFNLCDEYITTSPCTNADLISEYKAWEKSPSRKG